MEDNTFDISEIMDELSCEVTSAAECAVNDALEGALPEALRRCIEELLCSKPRIMVLSNDKTCYIGCYGGLKVKGKDLWIQTGSCSWDIFHYPTKEEAKENLQKIKKAMDEGLESIEL